ncbi:MAG TPA: hypothetical protein VN618_01300 [Solirubrobacteraceae bacterium]|nr:hypothetical protein [Solirubrobacteraceae bacterium]
MRVYRPKASANNRNALPVVACLLDRRTRMTLVAVPSPAADPRRRRPGYLERIAIEGDIAAYVVGRRTGVDTGSSTLTIADIARRIVLREAPAGSSVDAGFVFSSGITALDVAPDGSAAWIERRSRSPRSRSPESEVFAAARKGPIEVLDDGPGVEPKSLYLSDQTVNWVDDGITRSAPLPSAPS